MLDCDCYRKSDTAVKRNNQLYIASLAKKEKESLGYITLGMIERAKDFGITEGRLNAMIKFLETKGGPNN